MKNRIAIFLLAISILCIRTSYQQASLAYLVDKAMKYFGPGMQYLKDEPIDQPTILDEYDFIVIGAGSAGSVIANRLTEVPEWKILLIEAGQEENLVQDIPLIVPALQFTDANWNYKSEPSDKYCIVMNNRQCNFPRGKVMGGSSVLNYMIFTRGHRKDFDNWANLGNTGWDYENVLKYFKKLENVQIPSYAADKVYRNTGGYQTVSEQPYRSKAARAFVNGGVELGYPTPDINGRSQVGFSFHQLTLRNGTRCSTSRSFLHPIRNRPNLHVKKRSMVTKILINPETKTAYGVEFQRGESKQRVTARKEVIVSAGAINSPQLLMLSGIGPRKHLEEKGIRVIQDLPVGENLMDHVALGGFIFLINDTSPQKPDRILNDSKSVEAFAKYHRGPLATPAATEALAFFDLQDLKNPDGHPDLELLFCNAMLSTDKFTRDSLGLNETIYNLVHKRTESLNGISIVPMVMLPKSRGRILLKDADPFHHPLIYPNYFADEKDLDVIVKGVRIAEEIMKTEGMRNINATRFDVPLPNCVNYTNDSDEYWKCHAMNSPFTVFHLSGTCKMAPVTDSGGVVDPRLRVKGVKNLRVADASIMPQITSGHTNAPTIMIGEKASDLIKQDWNVAVQP